MQSKLLISSSNDARAAEAGLDWGQYNYATSLQLGRGVPQDRAQAFALFQTAAAQGHAKSVNVLGGFYEDGWEVDADPAMALCHRPACGW